MNIKFVKPQGSNTEFLLKNNETRYMPLSDPVLIREILDFRNKINVTSISRCIFNIFFIFYFSFSIIIVIFYPF